MKKYYTASRRRGISYIQGIEGRLIVLVTSCVETLLRHVTEGKIEGSIGMTGRRGRGCKQLLDDPKETRRHWKLKY